MFMTTRETKAEKKGDTCASCNGGTIQCKGLNCDPADRCLLTSQLAETDDV